MALSEAQFAKVDGTVLHIARVDEPAELLLEKPVSRGWEFVCSSIAAREERSALSMLDTVFCEGGQPTLWLFTNRSGEVMRKSGRNLTTAKINRQFCAANSGQRAVAVVNDGADQPLRLLGQKNFSTLIASVPSSVVCIQCYVPAKGGGSEIYANYRHEYAVQRDGRAQFNSYKLGAPTSGTLRESIRSMNAHSNRQFDRCTLAAVRAVETVHRCKVLRLAAEYVIDSAEVVWLVRTTEVLTVTRRAPSPGRSVSPPRLGNATPSYMAKRRHQLRPVSKGGDSIGGESLTELADRALRKVDSRRSARGSGGRSRRSVSAGLSNSTSALPHVPQSLLDTPGTNSNRSMRRSASAVDIAPRMQSRSHPSADGGKGRATKRSASRTALGSSQSEGCPGDFCDVVLDIDTGETKMDELTAEVMRSMGRLPGPAEGNGGASTSASSFVTYKAIVQARSEHRLVDLMLKRMQKQEKVQHDYMSAVQHSEMAESLAQSFPAHYYRQVHVCPRCFRVYSKIEDARQKALSKLGLSTPDGRVSQQRSRRRQRTRPRTMEASTRPAPSPLALRNMPSSDTRVSSTPASTNSDALMREAMVRANEAINRLTKSDVAEFRSFNNPPGAVLLVSEALMMLLTGETLPWQAAKRVMANGERFINMLLDFDGSDIPSKRIRAMQTFVRDVNFRPHTIEPVCRSAAAFCAWVLGTVQAHGYRTGRAHPRVDPLLRPVTAPVEGDSAHGLPNGGIDFDRPGSVAIPRPGTMGMGATSLPPVHESTGMLASMTAFRPLTGVRPPTSQSRPATGLGRPPTGGIGGPNSLSIPVLLPAPPFVQQQLQRAQLTSPGPSFAEKLKQRRDERSRHRASRRQPDQDRHSRRRTKRRIRRTRRERQSAGGSDEPTENENQIEFEELSDPFGAMGFSRAQQRSMSPTQVAFNSHDSLSPPRGRTRNRHVSSGSGSDRSVSRSRSPSPQHGFADDEWAIEELKRQNATQKRMTRREIRARRKVQERQMSRLHAPGSENVEDKHTTSRTSAARLFTCADGVTAMPYEVVGSSDLEGTTSNLVVCHDFFDTFESIQASGIFLIVIITDSFSPRCCHLTVFIRFNHPPQIFLEAALRRRPGCQALVFNYPGQAHTRFQANPTPAEAQRGAPQNAVLLNNEFLSSKLHELLQHVEETGEFVTSYLPFFVVGFGNGANVGSYFAARYGTSPAYRRGLRGLVSVNGFAHVDTQLAAVLHSSVNVFSCFPPSRPDLPVSYFTRFLFSDAYLNRVDPNLVLNIYTAVANPITLDGRIRLCSGALRHKDIRAQIKDLPVPMIVVQSTENVLVNPTNVDAFIEGRTVSHLWSHQFAARGTIGPKGERQLRDALAQENGAFVVWMKAGHEVRQESKRQLLDLLDRLVAPPDPSDSDRSPSPSNLQSQRSVSPAMAEASKNAESESQRNLSENQISTNPLQAESNNRNPMTTASSRSVSEFSANNGIDPAISPSIVAPVILPDDAENERERRQRLEETEADFETAMRQHREAKRLEESARRRRLKDALIPDAALTLEPSQKSSSFAAKLDITDASSLDKAPPFSPVSKIEKKGSIMDKPPNTEPSVDRAASAKKGENLIRKSLTGSGLDYDDLVSGNAKEMVEIQAAKDEEERQKREEQNMQDQIERLRKEQEERRTKWQSEDQSRIESLERELAERRSAREAADARRWERVEQIELKYDSKTASNDYTVENETGKVSNSGGIPGIEELIEGEDAESVSLESSSVSGMPVAKKEEKEDMEARIRKKKDEISARLSVVVPKRAQLENMFEDMEREDAEMKSLGIMKMEEYEKVKQEMHRAEVERRAMQDSIKDAELAQLKAVMAARIQRVFRGHVGRTHFSKAEAARAKHVSDTAAATRMQAARRGQLGRRRAGRHRELMEREKREGGAVRTLQRAFRGHQGRKRARGVREERSGAFLQRVYRGHMGRSKARIERERREQLLLEHESAIRIQSTWRMRVGKEEFMHYRIMELAAMQVQRVYRGTRGRRRAQRKQQWEGAEPGPDRLQLGMRLIEESKTAFQSQQEEIDALHRAQERAESRVSKIHAGLQESEKELAVLERELKDIDQLDRTLHELTHEKEEFDAQPTVEELARQVGKALTAEESREASRKRAAESYALEMAIHLKRAERERKKKELEAEFAGVFSEVETKKNELSKLEGSIQEMEATRKRKEREFQRLQRNLMELLEEQKHELDNLREKGIELETATATSAAAAAATAHAAKENEKRSQAIFNSTEELMKFQFMSMSLSYFSSLNMLKSLRDINADTTNAAVSSSADTAAAAAAAAAAANIPALTHMKLGAGDLLDAATMKKRQAEIDKRKQMEEAQRALERPFPADVRHWTVEDVGRWLDTLSLSQYKNAFAEASVDGDFLLNLRAEDMRDVLGMEHTLHVQKVCITRDKLRPLNEQEAAKKQAVMWESRGDAARETNERKEAEARVPTLDTVLSQIRNGRYNRLEESLNQGFVVDTVDSHGNTCLLVASQNLNRRMVELLLNRGANINHQNNQGNTAMHYAMAYDPEGTLGEYLIERGADDTLDNKLGLSPYDGID